eukprot:1143247-Pelagomonas_calceolata.AAC.10
MREVDENWNVHRSGARSLHAISMIAETGTCDVERDKGSCEEETEECSPPQERAWQRVCMTCRWHPSPPMSMYQCQCMKINGRNAHLRRRGRGSGCA